jgi:hypothetical protein
VLDDHQVEPRIANRAVLAHGCVESLPVILSATLALLCGPVLIDLAASPARRAFGYVAADAFYYLTVARNIARHGVPSYDGVHAANGFHPLWQAVCGAIYFVAERAGVAGYAVLLIVLVGLGSIAAGVSLLALALEAASALSAGFVAVPFGVYALVVAPAWFDRCLSDPNADQWNLIEGRLPLFGTLWSYDNGMESGFVLLFFGALAYLFVRAPREPSARFAFGFGCVAGMTVLSRLDHALLVAPVVLAQSMRTRGGRRALPLAGFALLPSLYLLVNRLTLGVAFPTSGAEKSSFPYFNSDHLRNIETVWEHRSCSALVGMYWREAQLCIPMIAALLYLAVTLQIVGLPNGVGVKLRARAGDVDRFLVPVALGVLALGGYDFLFVRWDFQGHWYFPVSTLFVTLAAIAVTARLPRGPAWLSLSLLIALFFAGIFVFVRFRRSDEFHARFSQFYWEEAPLVRAHYGSKLKILEIDDGIVAYSLDVASMSGGLMLDPEGVRARSSGHLLRLAYARGFDRIASFAYAPLDLPSLVATASKATDLGKAWADNQDRGAFDFSFDYVSRDRRFAILRMEPTRHEH